MKKSRVVVVDHSALVRSLLSEAINRQHDMECVGTADDPLLARELIRGLNPDVLVLDLEVPRMDGNDFLARLLRLRTMPVVTVASLTERGADLTLRALELGAVDYVVRPRATLVGGLRELAAQMVDKLRIATSARIRLPAAGATARSLASGESGPALPQSEPVSIGRRLTGQLIFVGASTGGTEAIRELLSRLPGDAPGVLIALHMPPIFTRRFALCLDGVCPIVVREAVAGEPILQGHVYIAPGGRQLRVARDGADYVAVVEDGDSNRGNKPSVSALFKSAASVVRNNAIGIMLTGAGSDGARAMREIKNAGGYNYVQDQGSCVVFGMAREAIAHGAADEVLPLVELAPALLRRLGGTNQSDRG